MTAVEVSCPLPDCPHFGKTEYVELDMYRRHLARDHDRADLIELAFKMGIIQDPLRFHNHSYIIQQIALLSQVQQQ